MSLVVTHNAGFFSCCSLRLHSIVMFFRKNKILPENVDSSSQFTWYKINKSDDITFEYFEHYNTINNINYEIPMRYRYTDQFKNYNIFDYDKLYPIIEKYFSPSTEIKKIITNMEEKYNIDYSNVCVLFYRGNDKNRETIICEYEEYIDKAKLILNINPNIKFLIQSDETEFIEKLITLFPDNSFYFKDEIRHISKCNSSVDIMMKKTNNIFSKYFLSITIIMSKCNYIICGSGNCSMWIMLYRGNNKNVYQNLRGEWYTTPSH